MKQKRLVVRARNTRRPLAKDALRRSYLRCFYDDAAHMHRGQLILEEQGIDPWCGGENDYSYDDLEDDWWFHYRGLLREWNRYALLNETARVWAALIAPSKPFAGLGLSSHAALTVTEDQAARGDGDAPLDERLLKHLALFWNSDRQPDAWTAANCDAVTRFASIGDLQRIARIPGLEWVVKASCLLGPFWLRRAQDFHGGTAREWLVHLFVRYPVPAFLYAAIEDSNNELPLKWLVWFLVFAQGGSLRRIARPCGWQIPNRLPAYLPFTAEPMSPAAAIVFAEARSLGCSEELARCFSRHRGYLDDPTEPGRCHLLTTFRQETAIWLAGHAEALTDRDIERVLDWARHRYTEGNRGDQSPFSWRGRQLRPVLAASEQYRHALRSRHENLRWPGHGWDWQFVDENRSCWTFTELLSGVALFDDGQAMRHCVGGYGPRCQSGASAIVSIRRDGERCLTVELAPRGLRIAQVHGVCNRNASADERKIVEAWMNAVVRHRRP
ncbi:PcfJ domain-containing protein [Nevskia sp.]|uniref:PcfJ domain-containing protein n=1 Tax=Nevskia sp. TaxID=1929292 RepID=UPI0025FB343B|nr:PcfJ domain-containing protein [Nevskia sp.]